MYSRELCEMYLHRPPFSDECALACRLMLMLIFFFFLSFFFSFFRRARPWL